MSWVRWGSKCQNTVVRMTADLACPWEACPGSSLYIYESVLDVFVCCGCSLNARRDSDGDHDDFTCKTRDEMLDHIELHVAAGHHVRPSLRRGASQEEAPSCAEPGCAHYAGHSGPHQTAVEGMRDFMFGPPSPVESPFGAWRKK